MRTIHDRRRHCAVRFYTPVVVCCYQKRRCRGIGRECRLGGDRVREERTAFCYAYWHR